MVVEIIWGEVIGHATCKHCGERIELFQPAGDDPSYWQHPAGPAGPGSVMTGGGISAWCRTAMASPVEQVDPPVRPVHESDDASVWAEEFVRQVRMHPWIATNTETMLGWFACAIATGQTVQRWEATHAEEQRVDREPDRPA